MDPHAGRFASALPHGPHSGPVGATGARSGLGRPGARPARTLSSFISADEAAARIPDGATVGLIGGGGGLMEAGALFAAIERRFLATSHPRNLTAVHALGIGDKGTRGMNHFAHEGLLRKVIGGHWVWSPKLQQMARDEAIEAYIVPGGVMSQLFREIGGGRPGLFTHVGLGTVCDPRLGGGRMNARAGAPLAEVVTLDGREYLRYKPFPVHVALIRASAADEDCNLSFHNEAANLDAQAVALAARASGGQVIAQVKERVSRGGLPARAVHIPAAWVDAVVVDPEQRTSYDIVDDPMLTGRARASMPTTAADGAPLSERHTIARRAEAEITDGDVVNFGVGYPDAVAQRIARSGRLAQIHQTIEHGIYGGQLLTGMLFGYARGADAILDAPTQFDFYGGGGLDVAFLGFGQLDAQGNVNVSMLGGLPVGPGGFIDIAQNARKVVFCGSFTTKGLSLRTGDGRMTIQREGRVRKLVCAVDQITFSGPQALQRGQTVLVLTERANFRLTPEGLELLELAPGIELQRDVLDQMDFAPRVAREITRLPAAWFTEGVTA
jgi:propionate CoA-transferase